MRRRMATRPVAVLAAACLMATVNGCSFPEMTTPATPSSTPNMADKAAELLGPIIQRERGRFSSVEISSFDGTLWMTNAAGTRAAQITFGRDSQLEDISSQTDHQLDRTPADDQLSVEDRVSVDPTYFDLDGYLAKVSETSRACGESYWKVTAEAISATAFVITQSCDITDQKNTFLNGEPLAPITNVWSLEGFTTIWNDILSIAPKGYVQAFEIRSNYATIRFTSDPPSSSSLPIPCTVVYDRHWEEQRPPEAHVVGAHCAYDVPTNMLNLNVHTAEEAWTQVQRIAQEKSIHLDEETIFSLGAEDDTGAFLILTGPSGEDQVYLDDPK